MDTNRSILTEDTAEFEFIYKYLARTFGSVYCTGCRHLAAIITKYKLGDKLQDLYQEYADEILSTPAAIERSVRVYLKAIHRDYTIEDFSTVLDYNFSTAGETVMLSELVPIIRMYLEDELRNLNTNTTTTIEAGE